MGLTKRMGKFLLVLSAGACLIGAAGLSESAAESAPFEVKRLVVCEDVQDLEPVGVSDTFSADTPKVYAFLEAVNIQADSSIAFVWYHGSGELNRTSLTVRQGGRWRTYANKNLYGLAGSWRVEIQDGENNVISTVSFEVE